MKRFFTALTLFALPLFSESSPDFETVEDQSTLKIETPSLQGRKTDKLRLANGMNVYLISDPEADKSGAAVAVSAGSWSDPETYPGMAHFCEHMLFLGTKKYPSDDEAFMTYVHDNNGVVNAYTAPDRTVYMFSITNDNFQGALDQFSHFFIDPLFKNSGVRRELHAVDQEHAKNIENDGWRQWMILKETGNPDHPNAGFSTGNAETLGTIPREALVEWYKEHYSANQMNLVIYSPLPLDELRKIAVNDFKNVPNWDANSLPPYSALTSDKQRGHMLYVEPIKDLRELTLLWEIPKEFSIDQDSKAAELISYVLRDGSDKSLEKILTDRHLAEGVTAHVERFSPENAIFELSVSLTKEGVGELNEVITTCFEALNLLKRTGVPPYVFNEMETMTKLSYTYQSREQAFSTVQQNADRLVYEQLETYPQKTLLAKDFYPQKIGAFVDLLTPQDCIYIVTAPSALTGVKPDKKERWLGGEYTIKEISKSYLNSWSRATAHGTIALPKPNPYIPTYLTLVNHTAKTSDTPHPVHIADDDKGSLYFWGDTEYRVPEIAWTFAIKSPKIDGTPKSTVLLDLYVRAMQE
ncbi:MAG: insulinase family protein, partial [Simkaniaceae bacterium]|nr:insulinase family protein [Simkaniaceae bacterium]